MWNDKHGTDNKYLLTISSMCEFRLLITMSVLHDCFCLLQSVKLTADVGCLSVYKPRGKDGSMSTSNTDSLVQLK